ncbi:nucleoside 2-deoxyribosyltransferase [Halobiforma lacisalsi AJ5]|uniref:Putative 2'-deoxynucleoside 5'-phosphate N-hydrolase 1 n=1 Tax=Natronobacterium lacisalsi AJ5 TaxID=358396 RepID=M0LKL4_NATLA|nr:nucleoside 2-deoxyribosyltransferase [Halobiforma lacisalsi]APW98665.1 nucleoside 2-deoxyribosyltransferase [Halobiforma lacisalsi AJ5]EMA32535.1 nucleoside 2-deoxyribosyltransferase [Halobiforma lacisalsi AJ5]
MDIYFGGSIRGGRSDVDLYAAIIDLLEDHGTVLTEHVGKENVEEKEAEVGLTDADIYEQDLTWLRRADVVVAEVTTPSLGVGYELGRAVAWGKPVCCLYRPDGDHDLSAMVRGNGDVEVIEYETVADVEADLAEFLRGH